MQDSLLKIPLQANFLLFQQFSAKLFLYAHAVEPPRMVISQQQPPPYNSQCLISLKCSFTIYLTSPSRSPPYNSHFFALPWVAVVGRLHCGWKTVILTVILNRLTPQAKKIITEELAQVIWLCLMVFWFSKDDSTGHSERKKMKR